MYVRAKALAEGKLDPIPTSFPEAPYSISVVAGWLSNSIYFHQPHIYIADSLIQRHDYFSSMAIWFQQFCWNREWSRWVRSSGDAPDRFLLFCWNELMGRKSKSVVSTRPQLRHANRIRSALDVAIIAAGEAHPMRWPRGLLTTIAQQHNVSVSHAHGRRRNLLPGVSSANGTIWCVNEFLQILFTSYCKSWCLTLENQRITWCK